MDVLHEYGDPYYPPLFYDYWYNDQSSSSQNIQIDCTSSDNSLSKVTSETHSKNSIWRWAAFAGSIIFATMGLVKLRRYFNPSIFSKCRPKQALTHEGLPIAPRILITGANSGIGRAVVEEVVKRNCPVIMACRDVEAGNIAKLEILQKMGHTVNNCDQLISVLRLDLTDVDSMDALVQYLQDHDINVHVLVNNAGVYPMKFQHIQPTKYEEAMAVNHLGHYYLTRLLLDKGVLKGYSTPKQFNIANQANNNPEETEEWNSPRIVIVSSSLAKKGNINPNALDFSGHEQYTPQAAYANSKLANCLFALELHRRFNSELVNNNGDNLNEIVNVYCVSTNGMVDTNLFRHTIKNIFVLLRPLANLVKPFLQTPNEGCQSVVHCALAPELNETSGVFYKNCKLDVWPIPYTEFESARICAQKLWDSSFDTWCSVLSSRTPNVDQPVLKW